VATTADGIRAARDLDELYRAHAAEVYRYVYAVLGNKADAEDVTQTTFVNALRALERGESPRKPTNWLITIAHNLIRQRWRQEQSRPREVELNREVATLQADDEGPSIDDLVRALQRIPSSQREALVLREMEGRSYKEIASILDVSVTALETLIFRARRSLAEELENLVTCDRAELALSQHTDGRLGRKERKRLAAHLDECPSCARIGALGLKHRRAFKGLAVLPLPLSLTLFQGAPSASAAIGLPTLGAGMAAGGAAAGGGAFGGGAIASGVAAKVAVALVTVTVAGGAGYEGVQKLREPARPATTTQRPAAVEGEQRQAPAPAATPIAARNDGAGKPEVTGRSASAPGRTKGGQKQAVAQTKAAKPKPAKAIGQTKAAKPKAAKAFGQPKTRKATPQPATSQHPEPHGTKPPRETAPRGTAPRGKPAAAGLQVSSVAKPHARTVAEKSHTARVAEPSHTPKPRSSHGTKHSK